MSRKLLNQLPAFEVLASLVLTACGGSAPADGKKLVDISMQPRLPQEEDHKLVVEAISELSGRGEIVWH